MADSSDHVGSILQEALRGIRSFFDGFATADGQSLQATFKLISTVIGASTAVCTLLGTLFGLSVVKIALLTLLTSLLVSVAITLRRLELKVRLYHLLLGGLAASILLVLANSAVIRIFLDQTVSRATGIIAYHPTANDFLPQLPKLIDEADDEVWFTGVSFYITLPACREKLLEKLEAGGSVRFLIYDPTSANLDATAAGFSQSREVLLSECRTTIENLRELSKDAAARNVASGLEVRLFSEVPKMRLYIFDRHDEEGVTYFIPHVDQHNTPNLPGFLVRNTRTGVAPAFVEGAERVWSRGRRFEEFLTEFDKLKK